MTGKKMKTWIGVFGIKPDKGCKFFDEGVLGGYLNMIALASSKEDFVSQIQRSLTEFKLILEEYKDVRTLPDDLDTIELNHDIRMLAEQVRKQKAIGYDTVYDYYMEEED